MKNSRYIFIFLLTFLSCTTENTVLEDLNNLQDYIDQNSSQQLGEVIACAASDETNTDKTFVFYFPIENATDIKYFETINTEVNPNDFSQYTLNELPVEPVFNGKLERFVKTANQEVWCIVTFMHEGKLHKSNPIRVKNVSKPSEWTANIAIDSTTSLKPKFSWEDGAVAENAIYFQVITDNNNNFLSGTYTTDKWFQYQNLSNIVLDINTTTPPNLIQNNIYNITLMGVSEDNWVNLLIQKQFTAQ